MNLDAGKLFFIETVLDWKKEIYTHGPCQDRTVDQDLDCCIRYLKKEATNVSSSSNKPWIRSSIGWGSILNDLCCLETLSELILNPDF